MSIMWQLCAASIDKNSGVVFERGKNRCQQWFNRVGTRTRMRLIG